MKHQIEKRLRMDVSSETQGVANMPSVLIVSDDGDFARTITSRWQAERRVPVFTLMSGELCPGINPGCFELGVVGEVRPGLLPSVLTILEASKKPIIFLARDRQAAYTIRETHSRTRVLEQHEGWGDALMLIAGEVLRASQALERAQEAESRAARSETQATLGRYMLEMRHNFNDALTCVLGNSELLLAQPGVLSKAGRDQIETIRNMSVRMNEILQRFSSLETELRFADTRAEPKTRAAAVSR